MLSRPYAFGCILRLRTSSDFKAATVVRTKPSNHILHAVFIQHLTKNRGNRVQYGHYFPDPEYDNVQRIICCDQYATYAVDFEFVAPSGFSR